MHDDGPAVRLPADGPHGKLCVQFAPLDTVLVSSSQDGSLNTWDIATCQAKDSYRMLHQVRADMFAPTDMLLSCLQFQCKGMDMRSSCQAAVAATARIFDLGY